MSQKKFEAIVGLSKWVGNGLFKSVERLGDSALGKPIAEAFTANAKNDLGKGLFYNGGKVGQVIGAGIGFAKTTAKVAQEFLDPRLLKMRKETGISVMTRDVVADKMKLLESDFAVTTRARVEEAGVASKQISKLKKELKLGPTKNRAEVIAVELEELKALRKKTKLSVQEKANRDKLVDAQKIIQGQLNYQVLENSQQGIKSPFLMNTQGKENFYNIAEDFNLENFTKTKYIRQEKTDGVVSDSDMAIFFDRIKKAQGDALETTKSIQMFVKEDASSRAAGQILNEIAGNKSFKNFAVRNALTTRKRGFETIDDLTDFYVKTIKGTPKYKAAKPEDAADMLKFDIKDNKLWYGDSHKSGAYELGGVNTQNYINLEGQMVGIVSDVNDIFKMSMPGGDVALTVSTPNVLNPTKSAREVIKKEQQELFNDDFFYQQYLDKQALKKQEVSGLLSGENQSIVPNDYMSANQRNIARDVVAYKPPKLNTKDKVVYGAKLGSAYAVADGLFGSSE